MRTWTHKDSDWDLDSDHKDSDLDPEDLDSILRDSDWDLGTQTIRTWT